MRPKERHKLDNTKAIFMIWLNWVTSSGVLIAGVLASKVIPYQWFPVLLFALELLVYIQIRTNREANIPSCMLTPFLSTRALFWSALTCLTLGLLASNGVYERLFETFWPEVPYIPIMVISPATLAVTAWALYSHQNFPFCVNCRMRHGTPAERGFIGRMYSQEGWFQVRCMFLLSALVTLVSVVYYFLFYINAGISSSDHFFFYWFPAIMYVASVLYMTIRYFNVWIYYEHYSVGAALGHGNSTSVRFLIFCNETFYLSPEPDSVGDPELEPWFDTPAALAFLYRSHISLDEARDFFRNFTGTDKFDIRYMYRNTTDDGNCNVFHYIVSVSSPDVFDGSNIEGMWVDMYTLEKLLNSNRLVPLLQAEIFRLHSITMAWKTYLRNGRRRYKIKHYRPTFRTHDIINWDVDFDDSEWLYIAVNNEDSRFYRIKRAWRRYINGIRE